MNGTGLAELRAQTLANAVEQTLIGALAGQAEACIWCGATPVRVTSVDFWTSAVALRCPSCGSELSGTVPRHHIEVPA